MNPIFKNALAMTLLLSASVAVPGSYENQSVEQILGKQLKAVKSLDSMCRSMWELNPNTLPDREGIRGITLDDFEVWEALGKTEPIVEKTMVEKTKDAVKSCLAKGQEKVQPYANKLASACAPVVAKAKSFGGYLRSMPQTTEGARLGGYLTLDNAKNVGTKVAVAAAAYYGLKALYNKYATKK